MKKILIPFFTVAFGLTFATSCIEEINPQSSTITKDQAANAPGSYDNFVSGITSSLAGTFQLVQLWCGSWPPISSMSVSMDILL